MAMLVLAGACFAAALAFSAGGWCALLPRGPRAADACARFGCGSLANTFLPAHAGNVVRIKLFGRVVPGGMLAVVGAVAVFSTARWLTLLPLASTALPPAALAVPAVGLAVAVFLARKHRASPWMYARSLAFAAASLGARVGGVALVTGSLSAALLVVPALELAGTISVTPANFGVAEGAAAVALHAHGIPMGSAMTTALVLHGVETAASVLFGAAGVAFLARKSPFRHRMSTIRPTTLWTTARTLVGTMRRKVEPLLCELHAHTRWSDGALTVPELVDLYGRNGFDVLCVTDHVNRTDDPWLPEDAPARGITARNHADYVAELDSQAERARREYDLLLLPGIELTYNDLDPYLAAHAVAVGCNAFVGVDDGIDVALANARGEGAALVAAHPYRARRSGPFPSRLTLRWSRDWRQLRGLVDRWELFNRHDLYGWTAERGLPVVANGDFHRLEHLNGWKTLLPCAKEPDEVVRYLRSARPAFITRVEPGIGKAA